jgi:hypothetical protein
MFKLIIAGSRSFEDYALLKRETKKFLKSLTKNKDIQIISGTARGADRLGERFASDSKYSLLRMPAQWARYGKAAGYQRNGEMAEIADACIVFWDGYSRGAMHMHQIAKDMGRPVRLVVEETNGNTAEVL